MGFETLEQNHHELRFEYPVLDLLDDQDDELISGLPEPENAGYRARPASSRAHFDDAGTYFFVRIPLTGGDPSVFSPCELPRLFTTIQQHANVRGNSVLQIAVAEDRYRVPTYHFRLITDFDDGREDVCEFTLTQSGFEQIRDSCQSEEWFQLMLGLINRSPERAYFHVHKRLRHHRWYQSRTELYERYCAWDQEELLEPVQILATNLTHVRYDRGGLELRR